MLITLISGVFILVLIINFIIKCRRLPPGPIGLPFVGYYPFFGKIPAETVAELSKKYGDVMTINILGDNYWFLNSFEAIEEAFVKKGDIFSGRPYSREFNLYSVLSSNCSGVIEGSDWKVNLRFTLSNMSLLGMGKSQFEYKIYELLDRVEDYVRSKEGAANDYFEILTNFASNVITTISLSKTYKHDDPDYIRIRDSCHNLFLSFAYLNFVLSGFGLKIFMSIKPKYVKTIQNIRDELRGYIDSIIDERLKTFDENNCRDLLDYFLKEMNGRHKELFHRKAITGRVTELIFAGTETTSATLYHALHLMAQNPKIQEKVYNEINEISGSDTVVSYMDRQRLPYTLAVISEIHRFVCLVPLITTHSNTESTTLCGFKVPKRQKIIANFYAVSRSPKYFKNPNEFDPNNFLDSNGNYLPNKALIPFSTGIRKCLGSTLAEIDIFLALTRLVQRFQWVHSAFEKDDTVEVSEGLLRHLSSNKICAIRRE